MIGPYLYSLFVPPHCPANLHCLWNHNYHPEHSGRYSGLEHKLRPDAAPRVHVRQHAVEISLSLSVSLIAFCVTIYLFSSSHRELVCFVEFYCRCIVNSSELMEIPFLHIKLPIPYNRLFPMSNFIKSTVPPHRLCAGENVKKR